MTTSSTNQQQLSIQAGFEDSSIDAFLASMSAPRKTEHCNFSTLQEEMQDFHNLGGQDVPNIQAVHHPIPEPDEVGATSPRGVAANEQLLQDEQLDIEGVNDPMCSVIVWCPITAHTGESLLRYQSSGQSIKQIRSVDAAVRTLLELAILQNAITVQHYRWIVMRLRGKLLEAGSFEILHGEDFARILLRLAGRLVSLSSQESSEHDLYFRPLGFAEFLEKLQYAIAEGFVVMQQAGMEDDVYIIKDKQFYIENLNTLALCLRGF